MTRTWAIAVLAAMVALAAPAASAARHDRSASLQSHTDSAATPAPNRTAGVTSGPTRLGSGQVASGSANSTDAAVKAENELLARKLKGICRGC